MSLKPEGYKPRLLDDAISRRLQGFGAVEVVGPKFCGKTWSSLAQGESIIHIDDDAVRQIVELDAALALEGTRPHIIDEWQDVPKIWDAVRRKVDAEGNIKGQFILTGSSTVDMDSVSHSGAGRIASVHLRPMSLAESGHSDGTVSLSSLFRNEFKPHPTKTDLRMLTRLICRGGWPATQESNENLIGDLPAQYLDALFKVSARKRKLDPFMARRAAVSLARNIGKTVTYKTVYADVYQGDLPTKVDETMYRKALEPYVSFFNEQYFTENQTGWDAPIKSKSRVRTKPRRCFADPSLPASLLNTSPDRLLMDTQLFGNLFEELCLRDLRIYASAMHYTPEPQIHYYSDADGLEVDAVIELPDGRWAALEIKLSEDKVPEAEASLLRLKDKVAANPAARNPEPVFLAALVGKAAFARQTPKGVYVVPLKSLTS
jgi:predicted AAA+ superfamily ATPase